MKNSKLVEEAKLNPTRIYHRPQDVLRDRRLDDPARLEILSAWQDRLRNSTAEEAPEQREQVQAAQLEIEHRLPGRNAAE